MKEIRLTTEQAQTIRRAIAMGLACYGELYRLRNMQEIWEHDGREIPKELRVIDPVADTGTVIDFSAALLELEYSDTAA